MVSLKRSVRRLSTAVCATAIALSAELPAEETSSYEMFSFLGEPGALELAAGDYDAAIEAASTVRPRNAGSAFGATANLCVALAIKRDLAKASEACESALTMAKRLDETSLRSFRIEPETAKAMTNRGVVKALSGDIAGAEEDFRAAAGMRGRSSAPVRNLAYMGSSPTNRLAMASATD